MDLDLLSPVSKASSPKCGWGVWDRVRLISLERAHPLLVIWWKPGCEGFAFGWESLSFLSAEGHLEGLNELGFIHMLD